MVCDLTIDVNLYGEFKHHKNARMYGCMGNMGRLLLRFRP